VFDDQDSEVKKAKRYGCYPMKDYLVINSNQHGEMHLVCCHCGSGFLVRNSDRRSIGMNYVAQRDAMLYRLVVRHIEEALSQGLWKGSEFNIEHYRNMLMELIE